MVDVLIIFNNAWVSVWNGTSSNFDNSELNFIIFIKLLAILVSVRNAPKTSRKNEIKVSFASVVNGC